MIVAAIKSKWSHRLHGRVRHNEPNAIKSFEDPWYSIIAIWLPKDEFKQRKQLIKQLPPAINPIRSQMCGSLMFIWILSSNCYIITINIVSIRLCCASIFQEFYMLSYIFRGSFSSGPIYLIFVKGNIDYLFWILYLFGRVCDITSLNTHVFTMPNYIFIFWM